MKLRIKGNSLRMRLSQTEVNKFISEGKISDSICFGTTSLFYELRKTDTFSAEFIDQNIIIGVPDKKADDWASTNQVGIDADIDQGDGKLLSVLVEKDFKCLTDRPHEDESDLFENPINKHDC